jgi:hypothetical protein
MDGSVVTKQLTIAALAVLLSTSCEKASPEQTLREELGKQSMGIIRLPPGDLVISSPLRLPKGARDMEIRGQDQSRLVASAEFKGEALIVIEEAKNVLLADFSMDGNRAQLEKPFEMAPPENAFRVWYQNNGILADKVEGLRVERVQFRNVVHFPLLVSRSSAVRIEEVALSDSGALDANGRNNLSGGILIEEGTSDFQVQRSRFRNIRGNALWTHSLFTSPQLQNGAFIDNKFETIGRDAILVGHAKQVTVQGNSGREIGYPAEIVDLEHGGVPVGIDTAGDVSDSQYLRNKFDELNGKCIDLDGFHDGLVEGNVCINRHGASAYPSGHFGIVMNNTYPDAHSSNIEIKGNMIEGAKYGGLFVMGSNNRILNNRFENLNLARCAESMPACVYKAEEPLMLATGIYLGRGVARMEETRGNIIRGNVINGHRMDTHCFNVGPGVDRGANTIDSNTCSGTAK